MTKTVIKRAKLLLIGALYTFTASILPVIQAYAAGTPNGATLNTHQVMVDETNKIVSWVGDQNKAYAHVNDLAWDYILHKVPNAEGGKPAYYTHSYINPDTQQPAGWPHNPAGTYAMFIESALASYAYSGNNEQLQFAKNVADHHLANGMTTATDDWANVPYASGESGSLTYKGASYGNSTGVGDGVGVIQPDKVGELGHGFITLYKQTGDTRYRDAAINAANALASHVRTGNATQSPWPFRVVAATGVVKEQYSAHIISPIELFDELISLNLGNTATYQTARTTAWDWMMAYPMQNNIWANYFEDVAIQSNTNNITQLNAMMVARYLLLHPETDPQWETHVRGLIAWVEQRFGADQYGAKTIKEQNEFMHAMGSHTSRYASVNALLFEKTGDTAAKEKAYRSFNWATYMARSNGVVIDGPTVNNMWFTDGYGDYIRHFMVGMGAVPAWAPNGQTHILRSSSVVQTVNYQPNYVSYTTANENATEVIKVDRAPTGVTVNGAELTQRGDLTADGWVYDATEQVVKVRHSGTHVMVVLDGTPSNQFPAATLVTPGATTLPAPAEVTLNATASDVDGTISKVEFYQGTSLIATDETAPYSHAATNLPAGTHTFTVKVYDNENAVTTSAPVTITVTNPAQSGVLTGKDIGSVGVVGSTVVNGGTVTVKGSGVDIWDNADSFHFAYQQMTGDGEIKARVSSMQNTDQWALAGVMIRETLDADSKQALAATTPTNGLSFTRRTATAGTSSYTNGGSGAAPYWMRLVRQGSTITAYKSTNGTSWTNMGSATISMAQTVYVGLAVSSHNNSVLNTSTFTDVFYTGSTPAPDTTAPIISNVTAANPNQNGATINWATNEPSNSQVEYGLTTAYGDSTAVNTDMTTDHSQVVAGLNEASTYHYRVKSVDAAGNVAVSGDYTFTTPGAADTTAPTVALTSPSGGIVSGTLQLAANASDNTGIAGVQFKLNGANLGSEVTQAPYQTNWDTKSVANGQHALTAVARDAAGNMATSALVTITVQNTPPPTGGLVASYNFNEGSGNTLIDRTGTNHNGVISGATWNTGGKYGGALSFNGTSNMVTIADANDLDMTSGMTLEAWVKPSTLTGWRTIVTKEANGGMAYSLYSGNNASRPALYGTITTDVGVNGSGALSTTAWWHITGTFDGSNLRIYVNGTLAGTKALNGNLRTTTGALRLGGNSVWGEYYRGLMDNVRIYNRALSASEIQTNMNTPL